MKPGSKFAAFLSKGATLIMPATMPGKSRAMLAAGIVGFAFLAAPAHAQTATQAPGTGTATAPRVVSPATVPPYAKDVKAPAPSVANVQRPAAPAAQVAPQPGAPAQHPNAQAIPRPTGVPQGMAQGHDRQNFRHDRDREYSAAPLAAALGAAIGMTLPQQVYVAPAATYVPAPGYYDQDPGYGAPVVGGDGYGPSYATNPAPRVEPGGFQAGRPQPVPADGRMLDPESAGKVMNLGGQAFEARDVFATVAAARVIGVDPSALFALESRAESAMQRYSQGAGEDNPMAEIAGPYAYGAQRWLSAYARFAPSAGIAGAQNAVIRAANGSLDIADPHQLADIMSQRENRYVASLLAAAEMKSNDIRYRQAFGTGPTMAELVVGHHAGADAMLRYSQILRQSPDAPLGSVIRDNYARDLLVLTGMSDIQPDLRGWTIGSFQARLDNALKNGLSRFAMAKSVQLPPDYKPGYVDDVQAAAVPRM